MRRPTKTDCLQKIVELGIPVGSVVDVGVLNDTVELRTVFRDKRQLLIEPIVEWNDRINAAYQSSGVDYELLNVAASDRDGTFNMETSSVRPGQAITHARLTDASDGQNIRPVEARKLDTILAEKDLARPYLLKLDVDGVEIKILEGARATLPHCSIVVIEANIKNFQERTSWLVAAGFELFDIVDICYYDGRLRQVDLVFANTKILQENNLDMYKHQFDMNKWVTFA